MLRGSRGNMAYTLENLDRVGVWYLDGPGHFAQYNFVREVKNIFPPLPRAPTPLLSYAHAHLL